MPTKSHPQKLYTPAANPPRTRALGGGKSLARTWAKLHHATLTLSNKNLRTDLPATAAAWAAAWTTTEQEKPSATRKPSGEADWRDANRLFDPLLCFGHSRVPAA